MEQAHEFLTDAVGKLTTGDDWQRMLAISRRLPNYSPLNCLLLATQGAQGMVMGYQAWKNIPAAGGGHCQVRRGATGLKVFAPTTRTVEQVDDATGDVESVSRVVGFRLITVFDQTALVTPPALPDAGAVQPVLLDLPDDEIPHRLWDALAHQVTAAGYRLVTDPETAQTIWPANGATDFAGRIVCVQPDLPAAQQVKTLAHELGHVRLHHPGIRPPEMTEERGEVEAESVAYLVTDALGLDSSAYSTPYVAHWSGGDIDLIVATAQRAITTARSISDAIDHYLTGPGPTASPETITSPDTSTVVPAAPASPAVDTAVDAVTIDPTTTWTEAVTHTPGTHTLGTQTGDATAPAAAGAAASDPSTGDATAGTRAGTAGAAARQPIGARLRIADSCGIETPAGVWEIRWDATLASFTAHHHTSRSRKGHAQVRIGAADDHVLTVGALEVRLGFALPQSMRDQLTGSAPPHRPGSSVTASGADPSEVGALRRDAARLRPSPVGRIHVPGIPETTYQAAIAQHPPLRVWDCHGYALNEVKPASRDSSDTNHTSDGSDSRATPRRGQTGARSRTDTTHTADTAYTADAADVYRVEILDAAPVREEPGQPPQQALTHRLSLNGTVIFSGDDVLAPLDTDPHSDHAIQQVVHLLTYADPDIPLTPAQAQFITDHGPRLRALATLPQPPYPPGTRILVHPHRPAADTLTAGTSIGTSGGTGTGVVVHATLREDGTVTSYAWRPDIAQLPGHPWRDNPRHLLVSRADHVTATLAGPDTGLQDWNPQIPLGYRAVVTFPADDGSDIPATVLRAHHDPDTGRIHYDLLLDNTIPSTDPDHRLAPGRIPGPEPAWRCGFLRNRSSPGKVPPGPPCTT